MVVAVAVGVTSMHAESHTFAGQKVKLKTGQEYRLEDWWDRLGQGSWKAGVGNLACMQYALRIPRDNLPTDDEVVYGKIGAFGHLIHESELDL